MYPRNFFLKNESRQLINYIIKNKLYIQLQEDDIWQNMEKFQICPGKSWVSMKQHFHALVDNSFNSCDISDNEKAKLLKGYNCTSSLGKILSYDRNHISKIDAEDSRDKNDVNNVFKLSHESNRTGISECKNIDNEKEENKMGNKRKFISNQEENNVTTKKLKTQEFSEHNYSEEEDKSIIKYFKENMNWNQLKYSDNIYANCQKCVLKNRSATSIKNRFLNVILPNLYKYQIVDTDEIPLFYDRAGVDIPPEMEQILVDLMETNEQRSNENNDLAEEKENMLIDNILCYENNDSSSPNFVLDIEKEVKRTANGKINMAVQTDSDIDFQIKSELNQICLNMNGQKYIFIPNTASLTSDQTTKSNKAENIHYIDSNKFKDMEKFAKLNNILDKKILKFVENEKAYKLDSLRLLPINYEKLRREKLLCSCEWEISKKYVKPSNRRKSKTVHLPIRSKKNKEKKRNKSEEKQTNLIESVPEDICTVGNCKKNTFSEKLCKCCIDVVSVIKKKQSKNINNEHENPIVYLPAKSKNTNADVGKQKIFKTLNNNENEKCSPIDHVPSTNENNKYPKTNIESMDVTSSSEINVKFADVITKKKKFTFKKKLLNTNNSNGKELDLGNKKILTQLQISTLNSKENICSHNDLVSITNENNEYSDTNIKSTDVNSRLETNINSDVTKINNDKYKQIIPLPVNCKNNLEINIKLKDVSSCKQKPAELHVKPLLSDVTNNIKKNNSVFLSKNCASSKQSTSEGGEKFINSDMLVIISNEKESRANDKDVGIINKTQEISMDKNTQKIQVNGTVMDVDFESDHSSPIISMSRRINSSKPLAVTNSNVNKIDYSMDDIMIPLFLDLSVEEQGTNDSVTAEKQNFTQEEQEQFEIEHNKIEMCSVSDEASNKILFELLSNSNDAEEDNSKLNKSVLSDISDTILKSSKITYEVSTLISQKLKSKTKATISFNDLLANTRMSYSKHTFLSNKSMKYLENKNLKGHPFMHSTLPNIDFDNNKSDNKINSTFKFSNFDENLQLDANSRDLLDIRQSRNIYNKRRVISDQ